MQLSDNSSGYIGRFAPSPTGHLHLGSLVTAIASYCDAKKNKGKWLVRIEDLDPPREIAGASLHIIKTLRKYGFEFSNDVIFQSDVSRQKDYKKYLNFLEKKLYVYYCTCSRKQLKTTNKSKHKCHDNLHDFSLKNYSININTSNQNIVFIDQIQGKQLFKHIQDFVIYRKDCLFSYQFAVVIDDFFQGVTHVVRGIDLLESTPWQIYLINLLNFTQPKYAHIPVLVNAQGQKLSKQTYADEINQNNPLPTLLKAYGYLNQKPFYKQPKSIDEFWNHAIIHWQLNNVLKTTSIQV